MLRLAEIPNIIAIKESSGNLIQITQLITQAPSGFKVFSGDDGFTLPILGLGGAGLVSVASNAIPAQMTQMVGAALAGDWPAARELNRQYFRLMQAHFWEPSPAPVKAVLALMGLCEEHLRLPMVPVTPPPGASWNSSSTSLGCEPPPRPSPTWCAHLEGIQPDYESRTFRFAGPKGQHRAALRRRRRGHRQRQRTGHFLELRSGLESGILRSAEPDSAAPTGWRVNAWVKRGILLGFRLGKLTDQSIRGVVPIGLFTHHPQITFIDKDTYPARTFTPEDGVRIVPGGSSVRSGAHVARGVVIMPPAYINAGAYVDEGTMVDSHALVGSCAQSASASISRPRPRSAACWSRSTPARHHRGRGAGRRKHRRLQGTIVRRGAVLAAGTILTRGTPVYDLVNATS